ncbi:MAG: VWA domain-containing protein [Dehalobacter sp. 4CP]|uniref:vWA domain-containing protein n=1 Tax=Dehalobacter sp. CP TaxID=2594474 RepID=UPI0013C79AE8|nr:VWA domain-containing protein [Dehalobacter sp.]NBJ16900.1 VWA domain-containing protein [Dehalobacter sp. 4CP]
MARVGSPKKLLILLGAAVFVFTVVYFGISLTKNLGKDDVQVNAEKAGKTLESIVQDIKVNQTDLVKGQVNLDAAKLKDSLPNISKYPAQVDKTTDAYVEIFSSTEKAGSGTDGWLTEVATDFNNAGIMVDGKPVSVRIRGIASGVAADYITSGKYVPDAFSPSNELWGEMIKSEGVQTQLVEKKLAGNVAGILISKSKNEELIKKYGAINIKTVTDAVSANELAMGYTNPFASSTGLNFLITALDTFDSSNLLSDKAKKGFETFQNNIPFVAYTTLQMRDSAKSGVLDGFMLEYQTYANSPELQSDYVFTPFGVRHDSPVYAIGNLSSEKTNILKTFIDFAKQDKYQKLATKYGFNHLNEYKSELGPVNGSVISKAQELWKEKKNGTKNICAVFIADVSGSMAGEPLNKLKQSLLQGANFIGKDNRVGLISYSNNVTINLPIQPFDITQRSYFVGAVNSLEANGNTATFDAIAVATQMIQEQTASNPDLKPMIFVLSDGATNRGHSLDEIRSVLETYQIPIYTIGYNAKIEALQSISSINEAASINADTDNVVYQLGNLFNAQM